MSHSVLIFTLLCMYDGFLGINIDEVAPKDDPTYKPQWVNDAIKKTPSLDKSNSISKYCVKLTIFSEITFPGRLCFVSTWRDVSLLEIKADPRRKFCETVSWGYTSEYDEICTLLDKSTSNCYGNYDIKLNTIGYIPTLCPQFPCHDFRTLKSGISLLPHNQIVNTKQPNDTSGLNVNVTTFDSSNLGYIRVSSNNQTYQTSNDCPSNMYGISYYWSESRHKSCTLLSQKQSKTTISYSDANQQFIETYCRHNSDEQFLGCLYTSETNCIEALEHPEYIEIFKPTKLRVSISMFIELELVGENNDHEYTGTHTDKTMEESMANANNEDNSEFTISSKISIAEFSFSFSEISTNVRICSDELFDLQSFIPGLNPETTLKFCLRATNWKTFMPDNGKIYVYFIPHFTATLRKRSSMSSLGFSGGIEYTANPFISFLNLQQPTNWLNKPDKNAVTRQDLKWFKPLKIYDRNEYKPPPDFTIIVLGIFLGAMGIYIVFVGKSYFSLKKEEMIHDRQEEQRKRMEEVAKNQHEEWERNIIENDEKFKQELNNFTENKSEKVLNENKINVVKSVDNQEIRNSKLEEYSDIQINEDELNALMNDSFDNSEDNDASVHSTTDKMKNIP